MITQPFFLSFLIFFFLLFFGSGTQGRLPVKGDKNGGPGACPRKIFKTTPFTTLENSIFCQSSRHNHVL